MFVILVLGLESLAFRAAYPSIPEPPLPLAPLPPKPAPTPTSTSAPRGPSVYGTKGKIEPLFKDSPLLTTERKRAITEEINGLYSYLVGLGFSPPADTPPIDITASGGGFGGMFTTPINPKLLSFSVSSDNLIKTARDGYSQYVFTRMLNPYLNYPENFVNRTDFVNVYWQYFAYAFSGHLESPVWQKEWVRALWQIRTRFGASFTEQALVQGAALLDQSGFARDVPFDLFFFFRFRYGEQAVTGDQDKLLAIDELLRNAGLLK
jgi:hypothetical protein